MEKYLVTIEFRYNKAPKYERDTYCSETVTIGVFDDLKQACDNGNKQLEIFERHFKLNPNYNRKERLNPNQVGIFKNWLLVTNLGYLETPFDFFLKVETLRFGSIEDTINKVVACTKEYREYMNREESDEDN